MTTESTLDLTPTDQTTLTSTVSTQPTSTSVDETPAYMFPNSNRLVYDQDERKVQVGVRIPVSLQTDLATLSQQTLGHDRVTTFLRFWIVDCMEKLNLIPPSPAVEMTLEDIEKLVGKKVILVQSKPE